MRLVFPYRNRVAGVEATFSERSPQFLRSLGARRLDPRHPSALPAVSNCSLSHPHKSLPVAAEFVEVDVIPMAVQGRRLQQFGMRANGRHFALMDQHHFVAAADG